ncbi:restriction endonuclease [Nitrospinae bacterium AH-259-F20]|nr:restriction endonuclease [Nitrospinae bacterium AH-259-F20]
MINDKTVWVVRAGNNNEIAQEVEEQSAVALGWADVSNLSSTSSRDDVKSKVREAYPHLSEKKVIPSAGQIFRFVHEMKEGDYVLTPIRATREVLIGQITGPYEYNPSTISANYPHARKVKWQKKVSRDDFTSSARNALGSSLTVFTVTPYRQEIRSLLEGEPRGTEEPEVEEVDIYADVKEKSDELISDAISKLDPYEFQDLVAGVLRAMGLRTKVSPPGPDHGIDIVAHPDHFGFEEPRIKVQVKHRQATVGGGDMRNFITTVREGEKGLFVSTGGYTKEAETEARIANPPVTCLDRDQFVDLLLEHYENMEPELRAMIPLKKVYIPVNP